MFTAPNPLLCTSACICCVMIMRRSFTMSVIVRSYQIFCVHGTTFKNVNHSVLCRPLNTSCDHILSSQGKKFRLRFFSCFYVSFFGSCMSHNENRLLNTTKKIYATTYFLQYFKQSP